MADDVTLKVAGTVFGGWTSISIQRQLARMTSTFSLGLTERWPGQPERRVLEKGQACEVWVGGELLITGWIDGRSDRIGENEHSITVSGRDKTGDIVDCSAISKPGSWKGQKLDRIASDLLKPFGLGLKVETDVGAPFGHFAVEHGEEVFTALGRAAKMRGVMLRSDRAANVVLYRPTRQLLPGSLEVGRNIVSIDVQDDAKDLFSHYIIKGQQQGKDWVLPSDAAGPKGEATDPNVKRYRPLVIISNEQATTSGLQTRARWEASVRPAKAQTVSVPVRGWRDEGGRLWEPGALIRVVARQAGVEMTLMISEVEHSIDQKGRVSTLALVRPEAFSDEALLEAGANKKLKKGRKGASGLAPGTEIIEVIK